MANWFRTAALYKEPRILGILFLSFSSGLPFLLTLATLHVWLKEVGLSKTAIGLFALVTIPYSLKFLWAPLLEHIKFPFFCTILGRRKGWMLASQLLLIPALIVLGSSNPADHILITAMAALLVSFCSATQDIVVEAYRVELLAEHEIGIGAGMSNLGYRLGMWVSGAGALYLASQFEWSLVYNFMAACMGVGIITTLLSHDPTVRLDFDLRTSAKIVSLKKHRFVKTFQAFGQIKESFAQTLRFLRDQQEWPLILLLICFYKLGHTALHIMSAPFMLEVGFSKLEIAHVGKSFGISAMIFGGLFAGMLLYHRPLRMVLLLCAGLQVMASFVFALQALVGHNIILLFGTIGLHNISCGMGSAAFITYLSLLSSHRYAATHFAVLTSFASLCRVLFSYGAGCVADHVTWVSYFIITALACCPFFLLVLTQAQHINRTSQSKHSSLSKAA
jgi:PAT family beta-lactamase induction signal transducer AmpG